MPSVNASSASVVQECLTNIHRHSGSKTALIRIEREENNVRVMVEDQGNGMSPQRLAEIQSCGTGVRIRGMRERVRHFHGDLVIESDGSGTRVHAILPLTTPDSTYQSETQLEVVRVTCRDELQFKNLGCLPGPSILLTRLIFTPNPDFQRSTHQVVEFSISSKAVTRCDTSEICCSHSTGGNC
jgi:Histidine kinase-, DNA gyrase B-, and HSP90-like ATPase